MMTDSRPYVLCFEPDPEPFARLRRRLLRQYRLVWAQTLEGAVDQLVVWGRRLSAAIVSAKAESSGPAIWLVGYFARRQVPTIALTPVDRCALELRLAGATQCLVGPLQQALLDASLEALVQPTIAGQRRAAEAGGRPPREAWSLECVQADALEPKPCRNEARARHAPLAGSDERDDDARSTS
jgi:hypothetical protein